MDSRKISKKGKKIEGITTIWHIEDIKKLEKVLINSRKDWKLKFNSEFMIEYINKKDNDHEITIQKPEGVEDWFTYVNKKGINISDKKFKTKEEAIKEAEKYMEKN